MGSQAAEAGSERALGSPKLLHDPAAPRHCGGGWQGACSNRALALLLHLLSPEGLFLGCLAAGVATAHTSAARAAFTPLPGSPRVPGASGL